LNAFNHSEFNVLLNNVSASRLSNTRRDIEYIFGTTGSILTPAYLQDSNESLTSYTRARYEGVKVSSLLYNTYTSASSTYSGDTSYGKTTSIDKNARRIGLFTEIVSSSLLPGRNRVALKYLVDEFGDLTELNQRNKHWEDIQRTFIAGDYLNVSQFDNQKSSNQKSTDGNKLIFESGYSYNPILYFKSCSYDPKIYFENTAGASSFAVNAINGITPRNISGSSGMIINYPLTGSSGGDVAAIFNTLIEGSTTFWTASNGVLFPTYSILEPGDYKASANFNLFMTMSNGGNVTWSFGFYDKNNNVIGGKQTAAINLTTSLTASIPIGNVYYISCADANNIDLNGTLEGTATSTISKSGGGTAFNIGDPIYSYALATGSNNPCITLEYLRLYSPNSTLNVQGNSSCGCGSTYDNYVVNQTVYDIPNFTLNTSGQTVINFNINLNPISNQVLGNIIVPKLRLEGVSTANFTASLSEGDLKINSLAVSTGYSSIACSPSYFNSSSLSASFAAGSGSNIITLGAGLSNIHNKGYQFVPNPVSGSTALNSLYSSYGDVDYPFVIKPYDILITYLEDNSYIESRIIKVDTSGSFVQLYLNNQISKTYADNIINGIYSRFLILSRIEDETSAYLTFKKREGSTSYGFIIPQNISVDVLANIDTITKEVKLKLLSDQSQVTINTF
jgi:hypothetical protein